MIFLNSKENERFEVLDLTECVYQNDERAPICGIMADRGLTMPFDVPSMPLCAIHAYEFRDWTMEQTVEQFISVMTEPEFMESLRLEEDDDI